MPDSEGGAEPARPWRIAKEYSDILREGHHKQAPACGSPTLVWHMAIWPRHAFGAHADGDVQVRFDGYDADHTRFFQEISEFAEALQKRGRVGEVEKLNLRQAILPATSQGERRRNRSATHPFMVCDPQAIAFTLWWSDGAGESNPNKRPDRPAVSDLRVRTLIQTHRDHATVSFFIDVAKSYGQSQFVHAKDIKDGARRRNILDAVNIVRRVSGEQIRQGYVELARIPENGVSGVDAQGLLQGADYCYDTVWREFADAFEFADLATSHTGRGAGGEYGACFADFRGLVMSIRGLEHTAGEDERIATQTTIRSTNAPQRDPKVREYTDRLLDQDVPQTDSGTIGFGPLTTFDEDANEGNTVLKSLWPFMRRMTPWADYKDWVACGIIGGRALYVTPLGSDPTIDAANEESPDRRTDSEAGHLPAAESTPSGGRKPRPLRYLVVTKGEPAREQVGRYVERINSIGTMRLFALRNIVSIRNASIHIEMLGRMLDGTLQEWESERQRIDDERQTSLDKLPVKKPRRSGNPNLDAEIDQRRQDIEDRHIRQLDELIRKTERNVIETAGRLDNIGHGGSGRMTYLIKRANFFAQEFQRMYPTLAIVDIDGWINYNNFVDRGMRPALQFIAATGERLHAIRERIQIVTETIQTAALIVEAAATQKNTNTLKKIAIHAPWLQWGGLAAVALVIKELVKWLSEPAVPDFFSDAFRAVVESLPI